MNEDVKKRIPQALVCLLLAGVMFCSVIITPASAVWNIDLLSNDSSSASQAEDETKSTIKTLSEARKEAREARSAILDEARAVRSAVLDEVRAERAAVREEARAERAAAREEARAERAAALDKLRIGRIADRDEAQTQVQTEVETEVQTDTQAELQTEEPTETHTKNRIESLKESREERAAARSEARAARKAAREEEQTETVIQPKTWLESRREARREARKEKWEMVLNLGEDQEETATEPLAKALTSTNLTDSQTAELDEELNESLQRQKDVVIPLLRVNYNVTQRTITGPFDIGAIAGFNKDLNQNIYYSAQNCWQRPFGYGKFYDDAAPYFNMHFNSLRFYFNYGGRDWLIQAWKGQYGITTGAEVGLYYKNENSSKKMYKAVAEQDKLPISITLYHNGDKMFHRPMETTWWQTGFRMYKTYHSEALGMKFSIKFKDQTMLNAFVGSITPNMNITYFSSGTTITVNWDME